MLLTDGVHPDKPFVCTASIHCVTSFLCLYSIFGSWQKLYSRGLQMIFLTSSPSGSWHLSAGHTAISSSDSSDWENSERGEDEVEAALHCKFFLFIFCLLWECFLSFPLCSVSKPSVSRCRFAFFSDPIIASLKPPTLSWKYKQHKLKTTKNG